MEGKYIIWEDHDKLCKKVDTTLAYIVERSGLITQETAESASTDIVMGLIELHMRDATMNNCSSIEITESDIDNYIITYFKNKLEEGIVEMVDIANVKNILFLTSIMTVMGYDIQSIAMQLQQPIEEIEYASTIINDNKIIE